ncbi:MAG TPA: ABC transporter substrate-binding protein, partial [Chloroflexota bacterium]|nr:ABC transporter substrate-binding protein [Chloroflexota bacterium]
MQVAPLSPSVKVQVGLIGSTSDAGFYIAEERGYFKDEGLDCELLPFQSGAAMVTPAATGQIDVATGATSAGLFNSIARDIPLRIIADKSTNRPGFIFSSVLIRKDLVDSGQVKSWADMKGRKLAVAALGNVGQMFADFALRRGGLTWRDVDLTVLSYPDAGAAFASKSLDANVAIEPFRTQWPEQGLAVRLADDDQIYPDNQASVVMYGPQFIQNKGEAAKRLMVAYLRGIRDYNDAFVKKQGRDAVIDILIQRTSLKDRPLYDKIGLPGLNPDGEVLFDDLLRQQQWFMDNGYQE